MKLKKYGIIIIIFGILTINISGSFLSLFSNRNSLNLERKNKMSGLNDPSNEIKAPVEKSTTPSDNTKADSSSAPSPDNSNENSSNPSTTESKDVVEKKSTY